MCCKRQESAVIIVYPFAEGVPRYLGACIDI